MSTLENKVIISVFDAARSARLTKSRAPLLMGISKAVADTLPLTQNAADQLLSDLHALNSIGPLTDQSVPLVTWLQNAMALTSDFREQHVFEQALIACGPHSEHGTKTSWPATNTPPSLREREHLPWWTWMLPLAALACLIVVTLTITIPLFAETADPRLAHRLAIGTIVGIALQDAAHWHSIRQRFGTITRPTELRLPGYWTATILLMGLWSITTAAWYHGATPSTRDCMLTGAAFPALVKQAASGVSTASLPTLGKHSHQTDKYHTSAAKIISHLLESLRAYMGVKIDNQ